MKTLFPIFALLWASIGHTSPISCEVTDEGAVVVTLKVPHPNDAIVYRPDGEVVWLQVSPDSARAHGAEFGALDTWVISSESKGTVWVDGKAVAQPVIKGKGKYHLYIAENIETEPENTYFIECYFAIGGNIE